MLYFIEQRTSETEYGPIKIGTSTDPRARLRQIQTSSPYEVWIMGVWPDCPYTEDEVHQMFAAQRMRGEWFIASEELVNFIFHNCVDTSTAFDELVAI